MISFEEIRSLLATARHELLAQFGLSGPLYPGDFGGRDAGFVNITLRCGGYLSGSMGGSGQSLSEAVRLAVQGASRDERFGRPMLRSSLDDVTIELWIETDRTQLSGDWTNWPAQIRLGRDGVTISYGASSAYYKPSVALTKSVANLEQLLDKLCRKAKLPERAWRQPEARVERTSWIHAVETKSHIALLEGLRSVKRRPADFETIRAAAELCLSRLLAIQKPDGSLGYLYHPFDDRWDPSSHCVRQAGCAYALARAASHPALRPNAATLALGTDRLGKYLLSYSARHGPRDLLFIREPGDGPPWGKLGATALTALAAQFKPEAFGWEGAELIGTLLGAQEQNGRFVCGIGRDEGVRAQNFFPGESTLALVSYIRQTNDDRARRALSRAFAYYKEYFYASPTSAFVVWQADAWTQLACWLRQNKTTRLEGAGPSIDEACSFVFDQIDWLLNQQYSIDTTSREDYLGGFSAPGSPGASSAAFIEAVIRALQAANLLGDQVRLKRYRESAIIGLQFIMHLQVLPEISFFFPRPELVVGGITASLESFEMRCDRDQHFLTACLTAMDVGQILWN